MSPASLMTLGPPSTPLLFYPGDKKIIRARDGGIPLIGVMWGCSPTCPLENGAPSTATLWPLLGCTVLWSLAVRRRSRGPLKAMVTRY